VLGAGVMPSDYAGHLLDVVRAVQQAQQPSLASTTTTAAAAMVCPTQFETRVRAILARRRDCCRAEQQPTSAARLLLLVAAMGALAGLASVRPVGMAAPASSAPKPATPRNDEDVRKALQAAYERTARALQNRDVDAYLAEKTATFTARNEGGEVRSRAQVEAQFAKPLRGGPARFANTRSRFWS
jgi:hypothetical protein